MKFGLYIIVPWHESQAGLPPLRGTPEVIIERLQQTRDAGIERIFGAFGFPGLPQWKVLRSIELFCKEVLPHVRDLRPPAATSQVLAGPLAR